MAISIAKGRGACGPLPGERRTERPCGATGGAVEELWRVYAARLSQRTQRTTKDTKGGKRRFRRTQRSTERTEGHRGGRRAGARRLSRMKRSWDWRVWGAAPRPCGATAEGAVRERRSRSPIRPICPIGPTAKFDDVSRRVKREDDGREGAISGRLARKATGVSPSGFARTGVFAENESVNTNQPISQALSGAPASLRKIVTEQQKSACKTETGLLRCERVERFSTGL